jgi:hypothetical protein
MEPISNGTTITGGEPQYGAEIQIDDIEGEENSNDSNGRGPLSLNPRRGPRAHADSRRNGHRPNQ